MVVCFECGRSASVQCEECKVWLCRDCAKTDLPNKGSAYFCPKHATAILNAEADYQNRLEEARQAAEVRRLEQERIKEEKDAKRQKYQAMIPGFERELERRLARVRSDFESCPDCGKGRPGVIWKKKGWLSSLDYPGASSSDLEDYSGRTSDRQRSHYNFWKSQNIVESSCKRCYREMPLLNKEAYDIITAYASYVESQGPFILRKEENRKSTLLPQGYTKPFPYILRIEIAEHKL